MGVCSFAMMQHPIKLKPRVALLSRKKNRKNRQLEKKSKLETFTLLFFGGPFILNARHEGPPKFFTAESAENAEGSKGGFRDRATMSWISEKMAKYFNLGNQ